ncbi:hypothetical protein CSC26_4391 [Pseudomonas aeruginosa]|nr:hypothetical protein CSC26_4391 [Pseudomonas aeruginosa]
MDLCLGAFNQRPDPVDDSDIGGFGRWREQHSEYSLCFDAGSC